MTFGVEELEWCGYPMVKNFEDMFSRFDSIHERLAPVKCVKSFATRQHLAASGGFSHRLRYTC